MIARILLFFCCDHLFSEIDECASDPCQNNGTCEDNIGMFNCSCEPGYQGMVCEIGKHTSQTL